MFSHEWVSLHIYIGSLFYPSFNCSGLLQLIYIMTRTRIGDTFTFYAFWWQNDMKCRITNKNGEEEVSKQVKHLFVGDARCLMHLSLWQVQRATGPACNRSCLQQVQPATGPACNRSSVRQVLPATGPACDRSFLQQVQPATDPACNRSCLSQWFELAVVLSVERWHLCVFTCHTISHVLKTHFPWLI